MTSIVDVATEVENYRQETIREHVQVHGLSIKMVHATLHNDLKLCKKSAKWLSKLMDKEMKKERVKTCEAFIALIPTVPDHLK
jgi:hypothetical protein